MAGLTKSIRKDYAIEEGRVQAYHYTGSTFAVLVFTTSGGNPEHTRSMTRKQMTAYRDLLTAVLEDWPE